MQTIAEYIALAIATGTNVLCIASMRVMNRRNRRASRASIIDINSRRYGKGSR